ncbi:MAG: hypothetical protein AABX30_02520 [Nanoarchaeota archaeon]
MEIKLKRIHEGRMLRLKGDGKIKDVFEKADIINPKNSKIDLCFRGENSSGIVEVSIKEAEELTKTLSNLVRVSKKTKTTK